MLPAAAGDDDHVERFQASLGWLEFAQGGRDFERRAVPCTRTGLISTSNRWGAPRQNVEHVPNRSAARMM
jgi:hypothetical protein